MNDFIKIRGARQHNLKNVNLDIPKNKLVAFTGVSGSGKSSLAFDTIYAEGQRRYVESLSSYARQFLGVMEKPDVDSIEGLSPSISIDQKTTSRNPRSTVGTVTEIYDYLRLLFARIGHPHCPICSREIRSQSAQEIIDQSLSLIQQTLKREKLAKYAILSPLVRGKKGEYSSLFDNLRSKGYRWVRVDGQVRDLTEDFVMIKTNRHNIEVFVDKIGVYFKDVKDNIEGLKSRLSDSIEQALELSDGIVIVSEIADSSFEVPQHPKEFVDHLFSERFSCPVDNISLPEIEPRMFSFNTPHGACPRCLGIGEVLEVDPNLIFSKDLTIAEGGILPFARLFGKDSWYSRLVLTVCKEHNIDPNLPIGKLSVDSMEILLKGTKDREYKVVGTNRFGQMTYIYEKFPGIIAELENRYRNSESDWVRQEMTKYMRQTICPECLGSRLKKEALSVTIDSLSISDVTKLSISDAKSWIERLYSQNVLSSREREISNTIIREILTRLDFLISVGLDYLTLERSATTLSGGESQRIRLASQIGSGLTGILYVLDEPTIGLHQKDNEKLINTLKKLRDLGNTVIVVEHDAQTILESDYVFDFGPGAGKNGGNIVAQGTPREIISNPDSVTGPYLGGKKKVEADFLGDARADIASSKLSQDHKSLILKGCSQYNLKNIDVEFPLGKLVVITGVSGSGKSTLLVETLYPALESFLNPYFKGKAAKVREVIGYENVDKVVLIDQSPIGRTPRSNPATYTKVFDYIRELFAQTKEARAMGFGKGRFSFNVKGGRCEACEGAGQIKIEMQFMSDIWVTCDVCKGKRYNSQTLDVTFRGKNISEVLDMSVDESFDFFQSHGRILDKLETLRQVGLGYMELGQSATTLSGGEAQRIKLAAELSKRDTGKTVYILDEPTTGLHFSDVAKLLGVLKALIKRGNSVFVIEHNLDVIKNADYIIDLGPDGGEMGGRVVATGSVKEIAQNKSSYTGQFLNKYVR
jgi:excinuclease ABC subunit A